MEVLDGAWSRFGVAGARDLGEDSCVEELDIRYARSGGVAIAYRVVGDGETDLVYVPDLHVEPRLQLDVALLPRLL